MQHNQEHGMSFSSAHRRGKASQCFHVCAALLFVLGVRSAHTQTVQQIAKNAFASTVLLVMEDANGQPLSLGSGFFVGDGQIASNLHVVEGAAIREAGWTENEVRYRRRHCC